MSGALIGIAGAVGAFGGVLVNLAFRQSFLTTGTRRLRLPGVHRLLRGLRRRHLGRLPAPEARTRRVWGRRRSRRVQPSLSLGIADLSVGPATMAAWRSRCVRRPTSTTSRRWSAPSGPTSNVCWCLSYRIPSKENLALHGPRGASACGSWCGRTRRPACSPTTATRWWAGPRSIRAPTRPSPRNRKIPHVDDLAVWSLWCIRVRPGHRGTGIAHHLVAGAVEFARARGAPARSQADSIAVRVARPAGVTEGRLGGCDRARVGASWWRPAQRDVRPAGAGRS